MGYVKSSEYSFFGRQAPSLEATTALSGSLLRDDVHRGQFSVLLFRVFVIGSVWPLRCSKVQDNAELTGCSLGNHRRNAPLSVFKQ